MKISQEIWVKKKLTITNNKCGGKDYICVRQDLKQARKFRNYLPKENSERLEETVAKPVEEQREMI